MFNSDNVVLNEIHNLAVSRGVFPMDSAFYDNDVLRVEGSNDGSNYNLLDVDKDYVFSPAFVREMGRVGVGTYSYLVVLTDWQTVRFSYESTPADVGVDTDMLTRVANASFDRTVALNWLGLEGYESHNPRFRDPDAAKASELEIFSNGLAKINEALNRLNGTGLDAATGAQLTALEVRQTNLETSQNAIVIEFAGIRTEFTDLRELILFIMEKMLYGGGSNVTEAGGFAYVEDNALDTHVVTHNLNSRNLDVSVWIIDVNGVFRYNRVNTTIIEDDNTVIVTTAVPTRAIIVVRDYESMVDGFVYDSAAMDTQHTIAHNLNTYFPSCAVWIPNVDGKWELAINAVTMVDANTITLDSAVPVHARVVVQRPIANGFIFKAETPEILQRVFHRLMTPYFTLTLWGLNPDGTWGAVLVDAEMIALSTLEITANTPTMFKAVLQPVILTDPAFELAINNCCTEVKDTHITDVTSLQAQIDALSLGGGGGGGLGTTYEYDSTGVTGPLYIHTVNHGMNTLFFTTTVYVEHPDGSWREEAMRVDVLDANTAKFYLTVSANIRVFFVAS